MLRIIALALATLLLALPTAAAAQTAVSGGTSSDSASCAATGQGAISTPASASSGGSPPGGSSYDGSSGGTPAVRSDSGLTPISSGASDTPAAQAAQEPQPEGPGQEQPNQPGGRPQPPSGEQPTTPGGETPGAETGGGLPRTGLEALKLALLGLVLFLVGARLRVLVVKRRQSSAEPGQSAELAPDGLPHATPAVAAYPVPEDEGAGHEVDEPADEFEVEDEYEADVGYDEGDLWSFPDRDEPAPTGLLPSTALARRQARRLAD